MTESHETVEEMRTFADLGLGKNTLRAIEKLGYPAPTPVQEQAIPLILNGLDVAAAAQTGTGKTAAFTLPLLDAIPRVKKHAKPQILIITPTRELAQQIGEVCQTIAEFTRHRILTVVGGLSYNPQIERLKKGVDVLIATPGRLIDLLEQEVVDLTFVKALVLDEADLMMDMGFWPAVKRIISYTPDDRQTLLFSATLDPSVISGPQSPLTDPALVEIAHKGQTADKVSQYVIPVAQQVKPLLLAALLEEKGADRVIVFARTKHRADAVCRKLTRSGLKAETIHANRSQNQRRIALDNFSQGKTNVIVATDVLARGIDVDVVSYVVNYDLPAVPEDYVHRIGRTGRAGESGWAVSFVTPDNKAMLRDIQKLIGIEIPEMKLEHFDMEAALTESAEKAARITSRASAQADPEIQAARKELAKKERKKRRERARAEADQAKKSLRRKSKGEEAELVPYPVEDEGESKHPYQAFMKNEPAWMAEPEEEAKPARIRRVGKAARRPQPKSEKQDKKRKPQLKFDELSQQGDTKRAKGKPKRSLRSKAADSARGGSEKSDRARRPFGQKRAGEGRGKGSGASKPKQSATSRFSKKPRNAKEGTRNQGTRAGKRQKRR